MERPGIFLHISFSLANSMGIWWNVKSRERLSLELVEIQCSYPIVSLFFSIKILFKTSRFQEIFLLHSPLCSSVLPPNYVEHLSDAAYHSGEFSFSLRSVNLPTSFGLRKKLFSIEIFSFSFLWKLEPMCERLHYTNL